MRNEVAQWLLEVVELEGCCGSVFPGAVQLFDRYLSKVSILPCQLQVTAITCLFIISKSTSSSLVNNLFWFKFSMSIQFKSENALPQRTTQLQHLKSVILKSQYCVNSAGMSHAPAELIFYPLWWPWCASVRSAQHKLRQERVSLLIFHVLSKNWTGSPLPLLLQLVSASGDISTKENDSKKLLVFEGFA